MGKITYNRVVIDLKRRIEQAINDGTFPIGFDFENAHPVERVLAAPGYIYVQAFKGFIRVGKSDVLAYLDQLWIYIWCDFTHEGDLYIDHPCSLYKSHGMFGVAQKQWKPKEVQQ